MSGKEEVYKKALVGKRIPLLTLDNKWHRLFTRTNPNPEILELEKRLNELLKRQGKLNTETKEIKRLKKRLMDEIVSTVDEYEQQANGELEKKIEDNKRLVNECNEKLDSYQDEMMELPTELEKINYQLMLATMELCYKSLAENTKEITEIADWIEEIRVELKKKIIRKQEKEQKNHELYSYMHDIFGADVIDIFDMKYDPEENHPKPPATKEEKMSKK